MEPNRENDIRPGLIRDLEEEQRPREKLIKYGPQALSDVELMAIVFNTGLKGKSVLDLSRDILTDNGGNMARVASMSVASMLDRYKGIGPAKAVTLLASLELGQRVQRDLFDRKNTCITDSETAYLSIKWRLAGLDHEEFWVILLSQSMHIKREIRIGQGGVSATAVDVRIIMREALAELASAMILVHNHPSGQMRPSVQDDNLTRKVQEAAKLFDIRVADHIIVCRDRFYSYADEGRL